MLEPARTTEHNRPMPIEWVFPGATPEQKQRALDAALEVFKAHHIQPEVAGVGRMEMDLYIRRNERGPLPHKDSPRAALIFIEAQQAAVRACGAPDEALDKGYIRVDFEPDSWGAYFARESRVLSWVDPEESEPS